MNAPMNIFHRTFTQAEVVTATEVDPNHLQNWIKRERLVGHKDVPGQGTGNRRQYSFFNLMEVAIANEIITNCGMGDLADAFRAAAHFAHFGDGPLPGKPGRIPGLPFRVANSLTLVIAGKGWSDEILFERDEKGLSLLSKIISRGPCVVVNATDVFESTLRRLEIEPSDVMREGYGD